VIEPITKELRELVGTLDFDPDDMFHMRLISVDKYQLAGIADNIDMEHKCRLDDCRHNTKRALVRYLRGVLNDYDRGIKRVRKGDKAEVVRCRDCMYARRMDDRFVCTVRPLLAHLVDADEYCSRGVRAEVDDG
jgi:hypothetical protein